jgi:hypothetical protein
MRDVIEKHNSAAALPGWSPGAALAACMTLGCASVSSWITTAPQMIAVRTK